MTLTHSRRSQGPFQFFQRRGRQQPAACQQRPESGQDTDDDVSLGRRLCLWASHTAPHGHDAALVPALPRQGAKQPNANAYHAQTEDTEDGEQICLAQDRLLRIMIRMIKAPETSKIAAAASNLRPVGSAKSTAM